HGRGCRGQAARPRAGRGGRRARALPLLRIQRVPRGPDRHRAGELEGERAGRAGPHRGDPPRRGPPRGRGGPRPPREAITEEPIGEAPEAASSFYVFHETLPDDGKEEGGGWQEGTAILEFRERTGLPGAGLLHEPRRRVYHRLLREHLWPLLLHPS